MELNNYEVIGAANDAKMDALIQNPKSGTYSCISCCLRFNSLQDMKEHYQTDAHRETVLRRTENYQPITQQMLAERQRMGELPLTPEPEQVVNMFRCRPCNKTFTTENTYLQHCSSKRHLSNPDVGLPAAEPEPIVADGDVDVNMTTEEPAPLPGNACLFCPEHCDSAEDALEHMEFIHGFHVPDAAYCCDVCGLMEYLAAKVGEGRVCLACGRVFGSLKAVQMHMVDGHHCRARYISDVDYEELAAFYDYSARDAAAEANQMRMKASGEIQLATGRVLGLRQFRTVYRQRLRLTNGVDDAAVQLALEAREVDISREKERVSAARTAQARAIGHGLRVAIKAHKMQTYKRLDL